MQHEKRRSAADHARAFQLRRNAACRRASLKLDKGFLRWPNGRQEGVSHPRGEQDQQDNEQGKKPAHPEILNSILRRYTQTRPLREEFTIVILLLLCRLRLG